MCDDVSYYNDDDDAGVESEQLEAERIAKELAALHNLFNRMPIGASIKKDYSLSGEGCWTLFDTSDTGRVYITTKTIDELVERAERDFYEKWSKVTHYEQLLQDAKKRVQELEESLDLVRSTTNGA